MKPVLSALRLALLISALLSPAWAAAPAKPAVVKPGIGLVLGGGGARGAAHIGVLKVLERERIPVAYITGSSMGAVIGGLYAAGYSAAEIEGIITAIDYEDFFDDDPKRAEQPMRRKEDDLRFLIGYQLGYRDGKIQLPAGVIQGQKMLILLRRLLLSTWQVNDFDQLQIPFRCVSTDIVKGEAVVFGKGDLALAIRSSLSVPGAFSPIKLDGRLLVDGGIVNNLPIDVARDMGRAPLIAVDVSEQLAPESELKSPLSVTLQMLSVLVRERTKLILRELSPRDVLIVPELGDFSVAAFERTKDAVPAGELAAQKVVARLRQFSMSPAEYARWQGQHRRRKFDPPLISFLDVVKRDSVTAAYVENRLVDQVGKKLDAGKVEEAITAGYGRGTYEQINWDLIEKDGKTGLQIVPVDKRWGPTFIALGLRLSDDFSGRSGYQLAVESTLTGINSRDAEWRNRLSLGEVSELRTEFYQPWGRIGQLYALPYLGYFAVNQPLDTDFRELSEYRVQRLHGGLEVGYNPSPNWQFSTGLQRGRDTAKLEFGDAAVFAKKTEVDFAALSVGVAHDTLDDATFPSLGDRFDFEHVVYRPTLGGETRGEITSASLDKALSSGAHRLLLGARLQLTRDDPDILQTSGALGGLTNLSGFTERELAADQLALVRAIYYRRLGNSSRLYSSPYYVGGSLEAGNVWDERDDIGEDLIGAGSVFFAVDTFIGPVFFGYGRADTGDQSWYLNLGSLLRPRL